MDGSKVGNFGRCEGQQSLKSVVMDGRKVGEFGKVGREQKLQSIVMDGVKKWKRGQGEERRDGWSQHWKSWKIAKTDEEMWCRSDETLCKSIMKGLARRSSEGHAMLEDVEEEQEQDVTCFDDITGKELPWHAVRKARELELKYLRDLGVYEKADEKEAGGKVRNHSSGHEVG